MLLSGLSSLQKKITSMEELMQANKYVSCPFSYQEFLENSDRWTPPSPSSTGQCCIAVFWCFNLCQDSNLKAAPMTLYALSRCIWLTWAAYMRSITGPDKSEVSQNFQRPTDGQWYCKSNNCAGQSEPICSNRTPSQQPQQLDFVQDLFAFVGPCPFADGSLVLHMPYICLALLAGLG